MAKRWLLLRWKLILLWSTTATLGELPPSTPFVGEDGPMAAIAPTRIGEDVPPVGLSSAFELDPASAWWLSARDQAGLVVLTIANKPVPGFCRLAASAMLQGVPLTVLGWNQTLPRGMAARHGRRQGWQLLKYKNVISALRPSLPAGSAAARRRRGSAAGGGDDSDLVVFVDGFDTFFVNSAASLRDSYVQDLNQTNGPVPSEAAARAAALHPTGPSANPAPPRPPRPPPPAISGPNARLVMSAECNKSPISIDYGSRNSGSELRFVNSGFLVGGVDSVRELGAFIDGALDHLGVSLCPNGTSQKTFSSKNLVRPSPALRRSATEGRIAGGGVEVARGLGREAAEEVVRGLRCTGLPGVSDQLFAHYAYLLGVANMTLDMRSSMCLNMFSCHRRGRQGFSPEEAVDIGLFTRTGEVSVRAIRGGRGGRGGRVKPSVIHANGNRKFLHWEQGIARALGPQAWRSGCVRAVGPGGDDRCRSFLDLGCSPKSLVLCDPASIGCKLSGD